MAATGEDAARFMRLLAVTAPSAGGGYLSDKFNEFVKEARVKVRVDNIRLTEKDHVAADLTISDGGVEVKYNVYLSDKIELEFASTDRSRVELAALLLKLAGVSAEVKKVDGKDVWYVRAYTRKLAAGHVELRDALAEVVREALARGWIDASKAEGWLEELENGITLMEGWQRYYVGLDKGALVVRYRSTNPDSIERETQRLREMGLEEGGHFTVKMPEGGKAGYVYILREGLAHAAWLSVHGEDKQQREQAAAFVEHILRRAEDACGGAEPCAVYEEAEEIVEKGKARSSLTLERFEKRVEVNGKTYVVKVIGWGAEIEEGRGSRKLLRIRITAEVGRVEGEHTIVDRVVSEYTITYGRYVRNAAVGRAYARGDAPEVREADAERYSALIKALTGREPKVYQRSDGKIEIKCYEGHLEGFMLYKEFFGTIMQWLKDTSRRGRGADKQGAEDAPQRGRHDNDKA